MLRHLPALLLTAVACADERLGWEQLAPLPDPLGVAAPFAGVSGEVRPGVRSPEIWSVRPR